MSISGMPMLCRAQENRRRTDGGVRSPPSQALRRTKKKFGILYRY